MELIVLEENGGFEVVPMSEAEPHDIQSRN